MSAQKPDITDEEIGMRSFRLRRDRAVERAMERIRQALGAQWASLSMDEVQALEWMLGELWSHIARTEWEEIAFSRLRFSQAVQILEVTQEATSHKKTTGVAIDEVYEMVKAL